MSALTNRYEDDDASRLPQGMKRVGYDADTGRYTFCQGDDLWLGEPGSFYGGQMKWAGKVPDAATGRASKGEEHDEMFNNVTDSTKYGEQPSRRRLREHAEKALGFSQHRTSEERHNDSDWGVPVVSITATGAEPPDSKNSHWGLKRRASKLKEVAEVTADTFGWSRWTKQRATTKAIKQEKVLFSSENGRRGRLSEDYQRSVDEPML